MHRLGGLELAVPDEARRRDLAAGPMQPFVLIEDNLRRYGEPLESTVSADNGAVADCRPDIAHPLER